MVSVSELVDDAHSFVVALTKMDDSRDVLLVALVPGDVDGDLLRTDDIPGIRTLRNSALHEGQIYPLGSGVVDVRHPNVLPSLPQQILACRRRNVHADHRSEGEAQEPCRAHDPTRHDTTTPDSASSSNVTTRFM